MLYEEQLAVILKFEGGYADHPDDPGGATNFGVTQGTYDGWRKRKGLPLRPVKQIAQEEVREIYRGYYLGARCDQFETSHPKVTLCHFDSAINQGISAANALLQRAINACWREEKLKVDTVIGPITLATLKPLRDADVLKEYLDLRKARYDQLIKTRPNMEVFRKSWYHRMNKIADIADLMVPWKAV